MNASWFGPVRFDSVRFRVLFRPVPELNGSVRFGVIGSVSYSILAMPRVRPTEKSHCSLTSSLGPSNTKVLLRLTDTADAKRTNLPFDWV